ncbi:Paired amphipathic helix protein Sin3a [Homalodisca vitripennis]|nr:Paired amphipathic helix protein Sin3a [Homalodisca vitripennis]
MPHTRRCKESSTFNWMPAINRKMRSTFNTSKSPKSSPASTCTSPPGKEEVDKVGQKRSPSMMLDHNSSSTSQNATYHPPAKKHKRSTYFRDVSLSDAAKHGTHTDVASVDKVHESSMTPSVSTNDMEPRGQQQIPSLSVEDCHFYLEVLRSTFRDKPQSYNKFLGIMADFRSQSDVPDVIDRVSSLFNEYPDLIVGFNNFLPPEYLVKVKTIEEERELFQNSSYQDKVNVSSPSAATTLVPATPTVHHSTPLPHMALPTLTTVVTEPPNL